ncbi:TetR/AcrR family transcriptional regulator [Motiliproteus coralliicola]|uniref:TetR/AcrR family transcriptional regulator n=1 Tax=Motiliproteus coralliicola TaxID=2283196 RepID=A0A369WRB8_9GAMM|nr:TetR/AcrR family transcriptional regulator [Motiliproteus coralliicola]RDE24658.1 TetR/AcrR family transcriptional regulator [Motiliproteus coralliicola]
MCPKRLDAAELQLREQQILDAARLALEETTLARFSMDRVVERVPYSKGLVYSHFSCAEDLMLGLGGRLIRQLLTHSQLQIHKSGSSRTRFVALATELFELAQNNPILFQAYQSCKCPLVKGKASRAWLHQHERIERQLEAFMLGLIEDAISEGALQLPQGLGKRQIVFASWANWYGVLLLLTSGKVNATCQEVAVMEKAYFDAVEIQLNSLHWMPLVAAE